MYYTYDITEKCNLNTRNKIRARAFSVLIISKWTRKCFVILATMRLNMSLKENKMFSTGVRVLKLIGVCKVG